MHAYLRDRQAIRFTGRRLKIEPASLREFLPRFHTARPENRNLLFRDDLFSTAEQNVSLSREAGPLGRLSCHGFLSFDGRNELGSVAGSLRESWRCDSCVLFMHALSTIRPVASEELGGETASVGRQKGRERERQKRERVREAAIDQIHEKGRRREKGTEKE